MVAGRLLAAIRAWVVANRVRVVPVATDASYLNRIECYLWAYVELVIRGRDSHRQAELAQATRACLRCRNLARHDSPVRVLETGARLPDTPSADPAH